MKIITYHTKIKFKNTTTWISENKQCKPVKTAELLTKFHPVIATEFAYIVLGAGWGGAVWGSIPRTRPILRVTLKITEK